MFSEKQRMCRLCKVRVLSPLTHFARAPHGLALRRKHRADKICHKHPSYFHLCIRLVVLSTQGNMHFQDFFLQCENTPEFKGKDF